VSVLDNVRLLTASHSCLQEEDFRRAVIADVAAAVHGDPQKITILGLEAGSIVVKMQLAPGVISTDFLLS